MLAIVLGACTAGGQTGLGVDLVSKSEIERMGAQTWQRIQRETPRTDNERYQATAERVAVRLLEAAGADPDAWEIRVFKGDQVNAFALPGRKIGIHEGMFEVAGSDAQLAAVIGHEIGHVTTDHAQARVSTQVAAEGTVQLIGTALQLGNVAHADAIAGALGAGARYGVLLPYSRNQELEADRIGLRLMAQAGYDPRAAIDFWRAMERVGGERPPAFLSTHPAPGDRIDQLKGLMPPAVETFKSARG